MITFLLGCLISLIWVVGAIGVLGTTLLTGEVIADERDEEPIIWIDTLIALIFIFSLSLPPLFAPVLLRVP